MLQITASEARRDFSGTLRKIWKGERFVVSSHGKPAAAIVSVEDLEMLEAIEDRSDLAALRESLKEEGWISLADIKAELGID